MTKQYNLLVSNGDDMTEALLAVIVKYIKQGHRVVVCSRAGDGDFFRERVLERTFHRWTDREQIEAIAENMGTLIHVPDVDSLASLIMTSVNVAEPKPVHLCIDHPEEINPDLFAVLRRSAAGADYKSSPYASMFQRKLINDAAQHELVRSVTAVARVG